MRSCPRCTVPCDDAHAFCPSCGAEIDRPSKRVREDPLVGRTLPGGYRVSHLVGVGGMGRVYCAEQTNLGRTVAVKVVHPHLADDDLATSRFLNEARAASRLSHPNSVAIFDFGRTDDGLPYIVMEYLRGRDLGRVADTEGPLPLRRIVDVLRQTLGALGEAHALGIVHRDLKPDNVVLEPLRSGLDFVKVVDFGLAKILESAPTQAGHALTRPGLVCGTPEYMSPEQGRGDPLDGRSDLYACGILLYELLTGRVPFSDESPTKTLLMHLSDPLPDPRDVAPDRGIPAPFVELVFRALAKAREDRFQEAEEFSRALEVALAGERPAAAAFDVPPQSAVRCRACGVTNALGQKFCGECGAAIKSDRPPPMHVVRTPPMGDEARDDVPTIARTESVGSCSYALPLVGRDDALAWLDARRHEAGAMFASAHVVGDAGIGKTRLVAEFLSRCRARGDRVVSVGPDPTWTKIADSTVRAAICALAARPSGTLDEGDWADARPEARTGLDALFGTAPLVLAASDRRRAIAEAMRWAIEHASRKAGGKLVVIAVDDLDFVDGTSRNAFVDVIGEPPVVPALAVVAYAIGPHGEPLAGERIDLAPLPRAAVAHLLPPGTAPDVAAIAPLHVEQLLAWSRESSDAPPARLADLIARRAERLPQDARHVLHALAVWGDDATPQLLRKMIPPGVDLGAALDALDRARIVAIDPRGVRIAHPLVRRVVFSSIPAGRKAEMFARAGELRPDAPLEVRAKQAMHAGGSLEALSLLDTLGSRRAAQGDVAGSVSGFRHALDLARRELHKDELDDPLSAMLLFARKLADALAAGEHWADAEGVLREALGNAPPASNDRARLLTSLAHVAHARRHPAEARNYLHEAMRIARQSDARELLPELEKLERALEVA